MLKATKSELDELIGSSPEAMIIVDDVGKIVSCNGALAKSFGYQSEDLIGADLNLLLPERFRDRHATYLQRFFSKAAIRPMSTAMALYGCRKDGTEFPVEVSLHPFETGEGTLVYAAIRDVTEHKQKEVALRESEIRLKTIVDKMPAAVLLRDAKGRFILINQAYEKLYGVRNEEVCGKTLDEIFPADTASIYAAHDAKAVEKKEVIEAETTIRTTNGDVVLSSYKFPIFDEYGQLSSIGGIEYDITERDHKEKMLNVKSNLLSLLYDTARFSNQATSLEEAIKYSLERVCTYLDWQVGHAYRREEDPDQLVSTRIWYLSDPERFATFRTVSEEISFDCGIGLPGRVWQTGKPAWIIDVKRDKNFPRAKLVSDIGVHAGFALPVQVGSDVIAILEFFAEEALQPDEPLLQMLAQIGLQLGQVAERVKAQEALRTAAVQAELARVARLITMGEMAASIAHEIKQPLTAVVTNANAGLRWLNRQPPNIEEVRSVLKRIVNDGDRGSSIIGSIREMMKKGGEKRAQLDLNELIREVMAIVLDELQHRGVSVRTELVNDLPHVWADRVQLQQVVLNLIMNAVEAMASVSDRPRLLRLRSESHEPGGVLVSVDDTGAGIDVKDLDRIFETFFTTKSEGMGMGLSICRSIVESHGGRISALRANPHGSVFQFFLPISEPVDHP